MESLALAAAGIVLLLVAMPVAAVGLSLAGFRIAGALVGGMALLSLWWFASVAPQVWQFYVPLAIAAAWSIRNVWRSFAMRVDCRHE